MSFVHTRKQWSLRIVLIMKWCYKKLTVIYKSIIFDDLVTVLQIQVQS